VVTFARVGREGGLDVLLLGGSGFVGRALLRELSARARSSRVRVRALLRSPDSVPDLPFLEKIQGSLEAPPPGLEPARPYVLVNLAVKQLDPHRTGYLGTNVEATGRLLDGLGPRLTGILYASSMSVYGQGAQDCVSENTPLAPTTPLSQSRALAEDHVRALAEQRGIASFALRPRFVIGEGDRFVMPGLMALVQRRIGIGSGAQRFSVIDVADYARIIASLAQSVSSRTSDGEPSRRAFNVGYTRPVTYADITGVIAAALHVSPPRWRVPASPGFVRALRHVPSRQADALATRLELVGLSHWGDTRALAGTAGCDVVLEDPMAVVHRAVLSRVTALPHPRTDVPGRPSAPHAHPSSPSPHAPPPRSP
jgi:nucleoside-diphosphate-sugar epimerase